MQGGRDAATGPGTSATEPRPGTRRLRHPGPGTPEADLRWRSSAIRRLSILLALPLDRTDGTLIIDGADSEGPRLITLVTAGGDVPCWLLTPPTHRRLGSAVVAVAGHGRGVDDLVDTAPGAEDFHGGLAHKLVAAGFTVLCPEMTSFGRRRTPLPDTAPAGSSCQVDGMRGLLTGRPVLGRRVADALAAVSAIRAVDGIDPTKIAVLGGSGGGAVAMLAAALDDRIAAAVVGTYLSSFVDSLCSVPHCICNAVPDLLTWFEMTDIAAMIAPRRLIIEAGRRDPIFPISATQAAYAELLGVWDGLGAHPPDLVITEAGHQFLADDSIALLRAHLLPER